MFVCAVWCTDSREDEGAPLSRCILDEIMVKSWSACWLPCPHHDCTNAWTNKLAKLMLLTVTPIRQEDRTSKSETKTTFAWGSPGVYVTNGIYFGPKVPEWGLDPQRVWGYTVSHVSFSSLRSQCPLATKEYTWNYIGLNCYDFRYIDELRGIGLSGFVSIRGNNNFVWASAATVSSAVNPATIPPIHGST